MNNPAKSPNLTRTEEAKLARAWRDKGDHKAREKIMKAYQKLAIGFAHRSLRPGQAIEDLIQEANLGLMSALDRFDPDLGYGFSTFARYHIISRLQVYSLEQSGPIRIFNTAASKALLAGYSKLRRYYEDPATGKINQEGRDILCKTLGIEEEQLVRFEMATSQSVSIDPLIEDEDTKVLQIQGDDNPEEDTLNKHALEQAQKAIKEALDSMDERDALIVKKRHLSEDGRTLDSIALELGISRERVRQIELRALLKIKQHLIKYGIKSAMAFFE